MIPPLANWDRDCPFDPELETLEAFPHHPFQIIQNKTGYRFSADAYLLAHFIGENEQARKPLPANILDLGTGCGIISLLLAATFPKARLTAVEAQESLLRLAQRNISLNKLNERISVLFNKVSEAGELADLGPGQFDLICSNPPFYAPSSGRLNLSDEKLHARHELSGNLHAFIRCARNHLISRGSFYFIYPVKRLSDAFSLLQANQLCPHVMQFVHGNEQLPAKLVLVKAVRGEHRELKIKPPIFLKNF